jgi:hypothetical protein
MCRHSDSEDLKITFECKHILCTDCFYAIEDEVTEDEDTVNALSRA